MHPRSGGFCFLGLRIVFVFPVALGVGVGCYCFLRSIDLGRNGRRFCVRFVVLEIKSGEV